MAGILKLSSPLNNANGNYYNVCWEYIGVMEKKMETTITIGFRVWGFRVWMLSLGAGTYGGVRPRSEGCYLDRGRPSKNLPVTSWFVCAWHTLN